MTPQQDHLSGVIICPGGTAVKGELLHHTNLWYGRFRDGVNSKPRPGGTVAPNLAHISSPKMIASDVYPNNNAWLENPWLENAWIEAWITHAQSLKPDCRMRNLTRFSETQLQDIVAYLRPLQ